MHIRFLVALVLLLVTAASLSAECVTSVSGTVSGTWTKVRSPYCVTGNIQVGSLTIEPGIQIEFRGAFVFEVPGLLKAQGTPQEPIRFVAGDGVPAWRGILFSFNQAGSELAHVSVSGSSNGGIRIENSASPPVIRDCVVTKNTRPDTGGSVFITRSSKVTLERCTIESNIAVNGGGGFTYGGGVYVEGDLLVADSRITNNLAQSTGSTGGTKYARGGGVYAKGVLEVLRSVVDKNTTIINGINSTLNGYGGGIYVSGTARLVNVVLRENFPSAERFPTIGIGGVSSLGGAIFVETGATVNLFNSTLFGNHAFSGGGGIYAEPSTVSIRNSIIWANNGPGIASQIMLAPNVQATVTFSDIQGEFAGVGNINLNPIFEDAVSDPFLHLAAGSPAIDKGTCTDGPPDDIDNDPRPSGSCDMGADEFSVGPKIRLVVDAAAFSKRGSPGSWITIFGTQLAQTTRTWRPPDFIGTRLPVNLDGTTVSINGVAAAISYVSPSQINALLPWVSSGTVRINITTAAGTSVSYELPVQSHMPELFMFAPQGRRYPAAVFPNGDFVGPAGLLGASVRIRPAKPSEIISLFGSGFGPTSPSAVEGELLPNTLELSGSRPLVRIGGILCEIRFAGLVGPGLYQLNVVVPSLPSGDHRLTVEVGGVLMLGDAFVAVQS